MKRSVIIVLIVIVIAVVIIFTHTPKTPPVTTSTADGTTPATPVVEDRCYIWNTEAGDQAVLHLTITDTTNVTGRYDWIPAQKDSKRGPLQGTIELPDPASPARYASLWWTATGEGVTNKEQLVVRLQGNIAQPGAGELKDRGDGVWVYVDQNPKNLHYDFNLQETDCSDPAAQIKAQ